MLPFKLYEKGHVKEYNMNEYIFHYIKEYMLTSPQK